MRPAVGVRSSTSAASAPSPKISRWPEWMRRPGRTSASQTIGAEVGAHGQQQQLHLPAAALFARRAGARG